MNDVKIIKLKTTEDIICFYEEIDSRVKISNPFTIYVEYDRKSQSQYLIMNYWLPINFIEKQSVEINYSEILAVMDPKEEFKEYYLNTVNRLSDDAKKDSKDFLNLFLEKLDAKSFNKVH